MSPQAPAAVVMVRPHHFRTNSVTAADNVFQRSNASEDDATHVAASAYSEVSGVVDALRATGVRVHLYEDDGDTTPDSVFPNNWFSTHAGGRVAMYPMYAPNRRAERRYDIIEMFKREYRVQEVIDYSGLEEDGIFLEGTGAMVFDYSAHLAYVARSQRANPIALERFCTHFGFEPMAFDAYDPGGRPVYHTNVMMCIATDFALMGLDMITDARRRAEIARRIVAGGRRLIELDFGQICEFAGNAIELQTPTGRILAMSRRGLRALRPEQRELVEASCRIIAVDVPTIEMAGGSVRCMLAGIHLDPRTDDDVVT